MTVHRSTHLFLLGRDYHLGDLLWFTAVLAEYRCQRAPERLVVGLPDRAVSRILEHNPLIEELLYGDGNRVRTAAAERFGAGLVVHDLRIVPIGLSIMRQWRRRLPWLYYRDLWMKERGQWLATFLGLGRMHNYRPVLQLGDEDRAVVRGLPSPLVVLAPHVGTYAVPWLGALWRQVKGWPHERWADLADRLGMEGYHPLTLGAAGQAPVPGTTGLLGLPIRQAAGVIEQAAVLITVESGLWFLAAALGTPFIITPWWLPRSIDWAAPMDVPHRIVYRGEDSTATVLAHVRQLRRRETA